MPPSRHADPNRLLEQALEFLRIISFTRQAKLRPRRQIPEAVRLFALCGNRDGNTREHGPDAAEGRTSHRLRTTEESRHVLEVEIRRTGPFGQIAQKR